jgi:hypothetical protein
MKNMVTTSIMMLVLNVACGSIKDSELFNSADATKADANALPEGYFKVDGYISPLNISVNGKQYRDSEDFYTQELARLKAQVKKEYPNHELSFDAAVGLKNFKTGMYVFLAASGDNGVASESYVDSTGKFSFMFDSKEVNTKDMYLLRATKRIGLRLTKGDEVISWCYNMYAEKEMALETTPAILRSFETAITDYQCSEPNEGIQLPAKDDESDKDVVTEMDEQWAKDRKAEADRVAQLNEQIKQANSVE